VLNSAVCLLVIASRIRPDLPLIVGANRDESLSRPALAMDVLRADKPRVVGGRDLLGGGTWLAVNEHGVVAGITNRPQKGGRNPAKRSRGELPIALASYPSAAAGVTAFVDCFRPSDFNPGWLAVADRERLFTIDMTAGTKPVAVEHPPGLHVFENCPPGVESPKVTQVRSLLAGLAHLPAEAVLSCVGTVLSNHDPLRPSDENGEARGLCLHGEGYGTRWSAVVTLSDLPEAPVFRYSDGPPCRVPFSDAPDLS
jgi:uncharacterized protein with NRDE domain